MNLGDLANVGELAAGIGTVLMLIFVSFELRANRRQNRLSMLTALDKGWQDINAQMTQDEVTGRLFFRGCDDPGSLTDDEAARFWYLVVQYINHHKSVWTLLTKDGLDTHHEQWLRTDISLAYNTPGYRGVLLSIKEYLPPEFIAFAEKQQKTKFELGDWRKLAR
jgi:hypothetical protein